MIGDILLAALGIFLGVFGIIGSIVPALPGPPISWLGMLVMYLRFEGSISSTQLFIWLGITVVVTILDYIVPSRITKYTGGSKAASWGSTIGMLLGMFLTPIGMILGGLIGAFVAEYAFGSKDTLNSTTAALGAFLGFLVGTGLKLFAAVWMITIIIGAIF
ncbi:MAG: DUF456 domain-containing protein [Bacteroidales bacterium]|nr:DUF456 domain-containing protein [Bacteroidales bacterium]MBQ9186077.1 DUF456 domain-containing protein [Bacteroidales bacterium]